MEHIQASSRSLWQKLPLPYFHSLSAHQNTDVCVIGAGIAGLSTAYLLLKAGKRVVVLERDHLGAGQTGLTSAHLSDALDDGLAMLRSIHGRDIVKLAVESHSVAIDTIERIAASEKIDCDFRRVNGYLFLGPDEDLSILEEEKEAALEAGMTGVELLSQAPLKLFSTGDCLKFPRQAQFHPLKYCQGLAHAVEAMGGKIFTQTEAQSIESGEPVRVATNRGFHVVADSVVVAANVPFNDRIVIQTKMAAYRSYCIGLRVPEEKMDPVLLWDTSDPYHYLRFAQDEEGTILIVGGEDHRTGQDTDKDHFAALHDWAHEKLGFQTPMLFSWSGQVLEPSDGLAYIGRNPGEKNVYICTGDSGHGLTHGTIAGLLLSDLICGKENPWEKVYEPSRIRLRSLPTYLYEVAQSTAPYADWARPGDVGSIQEIPKGEGAILRDGLQKIAVYRDSIGRPHCYSAVCPHLGGIVRWNGAEKTWDCPCHGSRFDKMGNVLNGPAATGLTEIAGSTVQEGESASA